MSTRKIIEIDEELCDGCGQCIPGCAEGALQIVDGKAKLVADKYCDGLGACLGECPTGALQIVERVAEPFDEEAVEVMLAQQETAAKTPPPQEQKAPGGCPSAGLKQFKPSLAAAPEGKTAAGGSALTHWPCQLRLVPPEAPFLKDAELLLLADCAALAVPALHERYVQGKVVLMGCPKFDDANLYVERLRDIMAHNDIRSLTVLEMEVPCCSGLSRIATRAADLADSPAPLTRVVAARSGEELEHEVLTPSQGAFAL